MATPLNEDAARKWTDAELEALERRMDREYRQAAREMREKQARWLEKFEREREQRERALDSTEEAMQEHRQWLASQAARRDWLDGMAGQLAESAHQANVKVTDMVNDHIPRVFSENANMAAFAVDKAVKADTGFTLVNEDAVRHLIGVGETGGQLIPEVVEGGLMIGPADVQSLRKRAVDYVEDMRWNRQKFTGAITQGILQGESIPNIVKRTESIYGMNRNAAIRAARTATTNAENAGRMSSFERAQRLGIDMEIEWQATLDGRTRDSHRKLDGERVKVGEFFESEHGPIRWPGDPQAHPAECWNCRCRADGRVVGFDGERGDWADEAGERWSRLPEGTTYEQWKAGKAVSRAQSYENGWSRVSGDWYSQRAAEAASAAQGASFAVDATAQIWSGTASQAVQPAQEMLSQADPSISGLWSKHERGMTMADPSYRRGAFHREGEGVFMNVANDVKDERRGPMSTFFHEFGHHLDETAGRAANGAGPRHYLSEAYRTADGRTFGDVIRGEVQAKVDDALKALKADALDEAMALPFEEIADIRRLWYDGRITTSQMEKFENPIATWNRLRGIAAEQAEAWYGMDAKQFAKAVREGEKNELALRKAIAARASGKDAAYRKVAKEIDALPDKEKHALADMFEGATAGKCQDTWGHGKKYWKDRPTGLEREAFAEFYSAEAVKAGTPETLATLKEWLPESHAAFMEIVGGAL